MSNSRVVLPGSHRSPIVRARRIEATDRGKRMFVTVHVRRKEDPRNAPSTERPLSRDEYLDIHAASANDFLTLREFARQYGLEARHESAVRRSIELHGTAGDLCRAFGTALDDVVAGERTFRQRIGELTIPSHLALIVEAILGLDDRPQARPQCRRLGRNGIALRSLAALHGSEDASEGEGQTVALIELGGAFRRSDLEASSSAGGRKAPAVTAIRVDGDPDEEPGPDTRRADEQVALDVQVAAAVAPAARQLVYFASNTERGFLDALKEAIHAPKAPAAIAIGWGATERVWTAQFVRAFEHALEDAALLGIPVLTAGRGFPASSPYATACQAGADTSELAHGCDVIVRGAPVTLDSAAALPALRAALAARFSQKHGRSTHDLDVDKVATTKKEDSIMKPLDAPQRLTHSSTDASSKSAIAPDDTFQTFAAGFFEDGSGSGSTFPAFEASALPPATPPPTPSPFQAQPPAAAAPTAALPSFLPFFGGSSSVAIVGVVGLASVVGLVTAAGVVATVALSRDRS